MGKAIQKYAKTQPVDWSVNTEGFEYKKPSELEEGREYSVHGMFITKGGKFGPGACLISDGFFIDVPQAGVDTIKNYLADQEVVDEILAGEVRCKVRSYDSKYGNKGYAIDFI